MTKFNFRVKFKLPDYQSLNCKDTQFKIDVDSVIPFTLESRDPNKPIEEVKELIMNGKGIKTEEDAYEIGNKVKNAIRYCGAKLKIGINLGKDKPNGKITNESKHDMYEKCKKRALNDILGLRVYDDTIDTVFISCQTECVCGTAINSFVDSFSQAYDDDLKLYEEDKLAFDLYGLSYFETSVQSKFITLITVIEVLSNREKRSEKIIEHIKEMVKHIQVPNDLTGDDRKILNDGINNLKKESIMQAGKNLVKILCDNQYGQKNAEDFFSECYSIRSNLVHNGKNYNKIMYMFGELKKMTGDLLCKKIANQS